MPNAIDYLNWRGDLDFSVSPFNEIDMFICSQLSTPDYRNIVGPEKDFVPIGEVTEKYFQLHKDDVSSLGALQSVFVLPMLKLLPQTGRFQNLKLGFWENKINPENTEQFSAVTILLPDGRICVSYRGTDDTLIGWKEDFHLSTRDRVPAQEDALAYLKKAAEELRGEILLCGHSKGGNLAVYAAARADKKIQRRIKSVYNFDGPGFNTAFLSDEGYIRIKDRITTVLSQNSLVGTLLEPVGSMLYVTSNKSGPLAHDGFSWQVQGKAFIRSRELSENSLSFDKAMSETLGGMNTEEKQAFVDELFNTLLATGAETVSDLKDISPQRLLELLKDFKDDRKVQSFVRSVAEMMIKDKVEKLGERPAAIREMNEKRPELPAFAKDTVEKIAELPALAKDTVEKLGELPIIAKDTVEKLGELPNIAKETVGKLGEQLKKPAPETDKTETE